MALYRHVRSRDELIARMVETARESPPLTTSRPMAGAALEHWSRDLLAIVRRHPWTLELPLARTPFSPRRLAWLEPGLRALEQTALSEDEKAGLVLLVNNYVFSEARLSAEIGDAPSGYNPGAFLYALVDPERFPALRRAIEGGVFDPSTTDRDADFTFGLERILDGIEHLIHERDH